MFRCFEIRSCRYIELIHKSSLDSERLNVRFVATSYVFSENPSPQCLALVLLIIKPKATFSLVMTKIITVSMLLCSGSASVSLMLLYQSAIHSKVRTTGDYLTNGLL